MTSVAAISSAVASINCLEDLVKPPASLPKETKELLQGLEGIKESLVAAASRRKTEAAGSKKFVELEKEVVRLSYVIVDAIVDASFKPKEKVPILQWRKSSSTGNPKQLADLQSKLEEFQSQLQSKDEEDSDQTTSQQVAAKEQTTDPVREGEEVLIKLRAELLKPNSSTEVYLVGESGMGKTTMARKLFHDPKLRGFFTFFAWVPITRNFQIKEVLQFLLQQLGPGSGPGQQLDIRKMNEIDLVSRIFARLKGKPYLVVLEDVESMDDWESIRLALPRAESSRVIITSSNKDVIEKATENKDPRFHHISGLSQTEIITLLKEEAALKSEAIGKDIYEISGGSPLFATILGKSLQYAEENEQQLVGELKPYMSMKGSSQILEASYKRLGPELRPRLLYLGQFPPGRGVDVDKLYLMLAAENLTTKESNLSPLSLIEYLKELGRVKLVHVQEDHIAPPTRGLYKSCRLHARVREFCRYKASDEEFLQILDLRSSEHADVGPHTRRLAIYLRANRNSVAVAVLKKLWTLLVIVDTFEEKSKSAGWPSELNDLTDSRYLRVLSFDGVDFKAGNIPKGFDKLLLLRYLSFRGCRLEKLPSSLSSLTQLETLDLLVQDDDCEVIIPNNIFTNKNRMLHLYFPRKYRSSDDSGERKKLKLQAMERLEILVNFDTEVCDVEALSKLKNLKILSTISKGKLDDVVFKFLTQEPRKGLQYACVDITSFDSYSSAGLSELKKLLSCKFVHSLHIEGRIVELQKEKDKEEGEDILSCSETIGEIFLKGSQLQLDPMTYLGKFQNLRSLVLSNDAFLGRQMLISSAAPTLQFPNLGSLKLENLQFLEKLTIEENAMPKLSALQIHSCPSLSDMSIPEKMDQRLKKAQIDNGGDAYSLMPFPSKFRTTPPPAKVSGIRTTSRPV